MVMVLSVIIAVIISAALAIVLYPITIIFWIVGKVGEITGKIGTAMFKFTTKIMKGLWSDIFGSSKATVVQEVVPKEIVPNVILGQSEEKVENE